MKRFWPEVWSITAMAALVIFLVWMARTAVAEVAFEASLRWRVPEMEKRQDLYAEKLIELQNRQQSTMRQQQRLIELLEAELAAREAQR